MPISDADLAARAAKEARRSRQEPGRVALFVGAVASQAGEFLDEAHRGELGPGEHAEFTLLERKLKTVALAGATIFTTLEPCTKRGGVKVPCAERLVERRVGRVLIGTLDPNPDIRGRGILTLRQAGIAVELFPPALVAELEELNRDFFRLQRAGAAPPVPTPEFLAAAARRTLDQWYTSLNSTYFHRNFDRRASDLCLHLVEVIGGLSLLASEKTKPGVWNARTGSSRLLRGAKYRVLRSWFCPWAVLSWFNPIECAASGLVAGEAGSHANVGAKCFPRLIRLSAITPSPTQRCIPLVP
jgi:pyrimidine deaminase RibD-like protein